MDYWDVVARLQNGDIQTIHEQLVKVETLALTVGVVEHPKQNELRALVSGISLCREAMGVLCERHSLQQKRTSKLSEGVI
jgi:hypothetical protein